MMDCVRERFLDRGFQQHHGLMLVEQDELRIDVRLDRKLMQQARAKAVNRGDHSAFKRALVSQPAMPLVSNGCAEQLVNLLAHALSHFVRGAIRERDRDDVVDGNFLGAKDFEIALNEHERLARARPGRDREVPVERVRGESLFGLQLARFRIWGYRFHQSKKRHAAPPPDVWKVSDLPAAAPILAGYARS